MLSNKMLLLHRKTDNPAKYVWPPSWQLEVDASHYGIGKIENGGLRFIRNYWWSGLSTIRLWHNQNWNEMKGSDKSGKFLENGKIELSKMYGVSNPVKLRCPQWIFSQHHQLTIKQPGTQSIVFTWKKSMNTQGSLDSFLALSSVTKPNSYYLSIKP